MAIVSGTPYGVQLAEAIGLDTKDLHSFTIEVKPDAAITVNAIYFVREQGFGQFVEEMRKFTLQTNGD